MTLFPFLCSTRSLDRWNALHLAIADAFRNGLFVGNKRHRLGDVTRALLNYRIIGPLEVQYRLRISVGAIVLRRGKFHYRGSDRPTRCRWLPIFPREASYPLTRGHKTLYIRISYVICEKKILNGWILGFLVLVRCWEGNGGLGEIYVSRCLGEMVSFGDKRGGFRFLWGIEFVTNEESSGMRLKS